jgi:hypothetical protein
MDKLSRLSGKTFRPRSSLEGVRRIESMKAFSGESFFRIVLWNLAHPR